MSNALVRKSLELLTYETATDTKDSRRKKKNKSLGLVDLIPVNHRLVSKDKRKGLSHVLKRTSKTTVSEAKIQLKSKIDPTEANVKRLLFLSNNKLDPDTTEKIFSRALKKTYNQTKDKERKKEEDKTAFNEEDFKKFEEEYFDA